MRDEQEQGSVGAGTPPGMHDSFRAAAKAYLGESSWAFLWILAVVLCAAMTFCTVSIFVMESLAATLLFMGLAGLLLLGLSATVARVNRCSRRDYGMSWGIYRGFMARPPQPAGWSHMASVLAYFVIGLGMLGFCVFGLIASSS